MFNTTVYDIKICKYIMDLYVNFTQIFSNPNFNDVL